MILRNEHFRRILKKVNDEYVRMNLYPLYWYVHIRGYIDTTFLGFINNLLPLIGKFFH